MPKQQHYRVVMLGQECDCARGIVLANILKNTTMTISRRSTRKSVPSTSLSVDHIRKQAANLPFKTTCCSELLAKFLHCVRTTCILRTHRLGHSPKNTCHLSSSTAKQQSPHENNETAFNLPTLNIPFFHKVQLVQTLDP